jgi:hypothetical protein
MPHLLPLATLPSFSTANLLLGTSFQRGKLLNDDWLVSATAANTRWSFFERIQGTRLKQPTNVMQAISGQRDLTVAPTDLCDMVRPRAFAVRLRVNTLAS